MGGSDIQDGGLTSLGVEIVEKDSDGDRKLKIPAENLPQYINLIKTKLTPGFWNEIIGADKITFVFKSKDGTSKEYELSPENEKEISQLCSQFNGDSLEKTANVYKYVSGNDFYHDFMLEHYSDMINR